jgi:hypothetical protein
MMRSWADFHVEPIEAEEWDEEYHPDAKHPHQRAIWRGIDLTTMHNDEVHGVKNGTNYGSRHERSVENTEPIFLRHICKTK